ncbi:hypothetical protein [Nostoc sp. FACHB-892]
MRSVKIFRLVQERFRLNFQKYAEVILTICGLVRFRIGTLSITNINTSTDLRLKFMHIT